MPRFELVFGLSFMALTQPARQGLTALTEAIQPLRAALSRYRQLPPVRHPAPLDDVLHRCLCAGHVAGQDTAGGGQARSGTMIAHAVAVYA